MRYRRFGATGMEVSELVFGAGAVGGLLINADDETKLTAIRRALDAGINFIDTAPLYGATKSEKALGWLLQEVEQTPYLSTKVRLDVDRLDDISGQVQQSIEQSLKRLRRDSVDLLQLHNPIRAVRQRDEITLDHVLGPNGAADALERVREAGLTRHIGFTALGDTEACHEVAASGRFASAQVYYNLLNPSAGRGMPDAWSGQDFRQLLAACKAQDVATMNIRVLAAGVIATDLRHGRESAITSDTELLREEARVKAVFARLGDRYGTRAQTALRFALANSDLSCVVFGLATLDHLDQALAAAEMGPLPAAALAALDEVYAAGFGI